MIRDAARAVLAGLAGAALIALYRATEPPQSQPQIIYLPVPVAAGAPVHVNHYTLPPIATQPAPPQPERPMRRVAAAATEVIDSIIGVVR